MRLFRWGKPAAIVVAAALTVAGLTSSVQAADPAPGVISGTLVGPTGAPRAGASVGIAEIGGAGGGGFTATAADGTFSKTVPPGNYKVSFIVAEGVQFAYGKRTLEEGAVITVASGQTVTVDDSVLPSGVLKGRVMYAHSEVGRMLKVTAHLGLQPPIETTTDFSGDYTFAGLFPGNYRVSVQLLSGARMWAPSTLSQQQAGDYSVAVGETTTLNVTMPTDGSFQGRLTDRQGAPMADVDVTLVRTDHLDYVELRTNSNGFYTGQVFTGDYKVHFSDYWASGLDQWAYGKLSEEDATVFSITAGLVRNVDDQRLATGSVHVTAKDSVTGQAITQFDAAIGYIQGDTTDGSLTLAGVAVGQQLLHINAHGYVPIQPRKVTVAEGVTNIEITLMPTTKIQVKVQDAQTGAPVAGVCVFATPADRFRTGDGCGESTDAQGNVLLEVMAGGAYNLFALPATGTVHGAQWLGTNGSGTGDQRQAKNLTLVSGQLTVAPTIKLDQHGTITGTVTPALGGPIFDGSVGVVTGDSIVGGVSAGFVPVASNGSYTIDFLGPYQWPLIFRALSHADQWSGAKPSRFEATPVQVTSNATTTFNQTLKIGATISLDSYLPDKAPGEGFLSAINAVTGDYADEQWTYQDGTTTLRVLDPTSVKLRFVPYSDSPYAELWAGGNSFATAQVFAVGIGGLGVDLCVTSLTRMIVCAEPRRTLPATPTPTVPRRPRAEEPEGPVVPRR